MNSENKTTIYLDQNFISDIAKLSVSDKKNKVDPKLETIFNLIKKGVDEEKFVVPDSWIHKIETSAIKDKTINDLVYSRLKNIGQVSFNPPWQIRDTQFINSLISFFKIKPEQAPEWWRTAFKENPNKRIENFDITVKMPYINWDLLFPSTTSRLQSIRNSIVKYQDQYKKEIKAARKIYKDKLKTDYKYSLSYYKINHLDAEKFIDSDEFVKIPNIDIFSKLWSKDLSNTNRRGKESDYNDVDMLSAYFPYVNIMATDNYWKTQIKTLNLDQDYKCQIFSMKESDLDEMITFLEKERKRKQPANKSLFSILCIMSEEKAAYPIKFLQKLNLAKSKFQGTGKYWNKEIYTEIFLLYTKEDEIKLPESETVRKLGPKAFTPDQWSEYLVFGHGFKKIYNLDQKPIEEIVREIPSYLKGSATAILNDNSNFDNDMREHDSYLFYDIEEAVENKLEYTKKYKVRILYS